MKNMMKKAIATFLAFSCLSICAAFPNVSAEEDTLKFEGESTPFTAIDSEGYTIKSSNSRNTWAWSLNLGGASDGSDDDGGRRRRSSWNARAPIIPRPRRTVASL